MPDQLLPYLTIERSMKPNSVRLVMGRVGLFQKWLGKREISNEAINEFLMEKYQATKNNNTVNSYVCAINKLLEFYNSRQLFEECHLKTVKSLKKHRPPITILTPSQLKSLWELDYIRGRTKVHMAEKVRNNGIFKTAICFLSLTGCRFSEMSHLLREDIDLENNQVTFKETKNGDWRIVGLNEPLTSMLRELKNNTKNQAYIFSTSRGKPIHATDFNDELKERASILHIPIRVHAHLFRHSFATQMLDSGVGVEKCASILGHRDIQSTFYYTHLAIATLKREMLKNPLIAEAADGKALLNSIADVLSSLQQTGNKNLNFMMKKTDKALEFKVFLKEIVEILLFSVFFSCFYYI